jgi:hypothetical protein
MTLKRPLTDSRIVRVDTQRRTPNIRLLLYTHDAILRSNESEPLRLFINWVVLAPAYLHAIQQARVLGVGRNRSALDPADESQGRAVAMITHVVVKQIWCRKNGTINGEDAYLPRAQKQSLAVPDKRRAWSRAQLAVVQSTSWINDDAAEPPEGIQKHLGRLGGWEAVGRIEPADVVRFAAVCVVR